MEKVKLPREVCDALDDVKNSVGNKNIIRRNIERTWNDKYHCLNEVNTDLLMRALVIGYEPELTAEEQTKACYFDIYSSDNHANKAYKEGIRDALKAHAIHYDWMDDAE